jgi:hypothetical protein
MPYKIAFLEGGIGLLKTFSGDVTAQDFITAENELLSIPQQVAACRYAIADLTSVCSMNISASELRQLSDLNARMAAVQPRLAVAVVAPMDVAYGLSRMWQVLAEKTRWEIMVFRTRAEGEDWARQRSESVAGRQSVGPIS